ncbi:MULTISPECIES: DUF2231 domain-containing protein [Asticcacaulis]|uniref:DUF2231 domain-containing protein n=1 Tax=Asticcacaulis TaxID=76890 RepID=UPI001FD94607|nr:MULTISPECIES: DUF2231 domain-containing protein [Asticcacaulis]MBP2159007.1 putative membrane protein [Asticcacaulis solisilvae]MDR6800052.1 putative membrane protein [Asticcacaulis sp. BE141]
MKTNILKWLAVFGALFVVSIAALPASAHKNHAQESSAVAASSATSLSGASDAAMSDMPGMEMSWPTATDSGMSMGMDMNKPKPTTFVGRLIAWLGAWHPALIHFPIALTLVVAFLELAGAVRKQPVYTAANKILLALAALGAFVAAPAGWMDAGWPTAQDELVLTLHRWTGTAIPFLLLALWYFKRPAEVAATRPSSRGYEMLLALAVVVILTQAFMGGEITHGAGHMNF